MSNDPPYKVLIQYIDRGEVIWITQDCLFKLLDDLLMFLNHQIVHMHLKGLDSNMNETEIKV